MVGIDYLAPIDDFKSFRQLEELGFRFRESEVGQCKALMAYARGIEG